MALDPSNGGRQVFESKEIEDFFEFGLRSAILEAGQFRFARRSSFFLTLGRQFLIAGVPFRTGVTAFKTAPEDHAGKFRAFRAVRKVSSGEENLQRH